VTVKEDDTSLSAYKVVFSKGSSKTMANFLFRDVAYQNIHMIIIENKIIAKNNN
jgi:hypothetical protein